MIREINLVLTPKQASAEQYYLPQASKILKCSSQQILSHQIIGKSIDARRGKVKINLKLKVGIDEQLPSEEIIPPNYKNVESAQSVLVVGAGPTGLFAALKLIELGIKPIVVERGKDVVSRKRDIAKIHKNEEINPNSNYAFGEGGAGTFSDGKLYTRSKKRGNVQGVLHTLVQHGANQNILINSHPHIGSDKLPIIIKSIRETIIDYGGEVKFNSNLEKLVVKNKRIEGAVVNGQKIESQAVILSTGHSARDVYTMLYEQGITIEGKSFAMGVRVEHPQGLIDSIQYSCNSRGDYLPAASYSLVKQFNGRGVYSFCMCPGGVIVPASTSPKEMVVNGMSPSGRNTKWANSGMVVEIRQNDLPDGLTNPLAGLEFQKKFEQDAFINGGQGQIAPSQRMVDFSESRISQNLSVSSFRPSLQTSPLHEWMPPHINQRLQQAFVEFGKKMKGYYTNEAVLIGVESRTSSPVRIPRNNETMQHISTEGLFPCGEGSGYAGGITSSAIDGANAAIKVAEFLNNKN